MKTPPTKAEKFAAPVVALFGAVIIALAWAGMLAPLNAQRRSLEKNISGISDDLKRSNYLLGPDALRKEKSSEEGLYISLISEWSNTITRVAGLKGIDFPTSDRMGKIDYKVALFDTRQRLFKKARAMEISLPRDLGMESTVHSTEDSRRLMLQLRTVERLVDLALNLKIRSISSVEPLQPEEHPATESTKTFVEEYPVKLRFIGNIDNLFDIFAGILDEQHFFVLRRIKVESAAEKSSELLNIEVVMSSLLFTTKPENVASSVVVSAPTRISPQGH